MLVAKPVFDSGPARVMRPAGTVTFIRELIELPEYRSVAGAAAKSAISVQN
jgi:hypothetical protein